MSQVPPMLTTADEAVSATRWTTVYLTLLLPLRRHTLVMLVLSLIGMALQVPLPFLVADIVDGLARQMRLAELAPLIAWVTVFTLAALALSTGLQVLGAWLATDFVRNVRIACFDRLQMAHPSLLREFDVSDLQARMVGDMQSLNHLLPPGLVNVTRHVLFLLVFGGILFYLSPLIVACIAGFLPVAALIFRIGSRRLSALSSDAYRGNALLNATLLESLQGLRESRVTGACGFHKQRLAHSLAESRLRWLRALRQGALLGGVLGLIPIAVAAMIWSVGATMVAAGEMSVGEIVSFLMVLSMLYGPINGLFTAASGIVQEKVAMGRLADILKLGKLEFAAPTSTQVNEGAFLSSAPPTVELRGVSFGYGRQHVIQGLDALIPGGSVALLTGHNGVGKSTLADLIVGLEVPSGGQILLDGVSISFWPEQVRRCSVGLLSQHTQLYAGSLRLNITLGRSLSDSQIYSIATEMALESFLADWPNGLDGMIQEAGRDLSGGQRQKIALLRALVHRPRLLVLDEPENNLDTVTVVQFADFLKRHKGKFTVLLITHGAEFRHLADMVINLSGYDTNRTICPLEEGNGCISRPDAKMSKGSQYEIKCP